MRRQSSIPLAPSARLEPRVAGAMRDVHCEAWYDKGCVDPYDDR
jgi:hypothetical protein